MKQVPPILRHLALSTAACFAWSFIAAPTAIAATYHAPVNPGRTRVLSAAELTHMVGSVTPIPISSVGDNPAATPGAAYTWDGSVDGVETGNGNKMTSVPIVKWTARGGLPVDFTLYHNSESLRATEGPKWTNSFDTQISVDASTGNVTLYWGDGRVVLYTKNIDGSYSAPAGIHDKLTANVVSGSITSYDVKTKTQVRYRLTTWTATSFFLTSITDLNSNTITVNRDAAGRLTSVVDPNSRTLTVSYITVFGQLLPGTITDPQGRQWAMAYTSSKQLYQVVWPTLSGTTVEQFGYDANSNITSYTHRNGNTSSATYNADNSIATATDPCGNAVIFGYTSTATTVTDPNSHQTVYHYNTLSQLTSVTDALSLSESYTYDSDNNVTTLVDRRAHSWISTYDAMGNKLTYKNPYTNTTTYTYNSFNQVTSVLYPMGESTVISYDANGNEVQSQDKNSSGTVIATTTYVIGSYGLKSSKTDPFSHTLSYTYDTNGDLATLTTGLSHVTHWYYNTLGVVTSRVDAKSQTTTYTLDAWNRVTTIAYPVGSRTFQYDKNDNITQFVDATGTTTRTYDADDRLLTEVKGSVTLLTHQYDFTGQLGLLSRVFDGDSSTGRWINYSYTVRNQLYKVAEGTSISSPGTTYTYDNNGNETGATNANSTYSRIVYDNANRVTQRASSQSWVNDFSWFNYTYNSDSLVISGTDDNGSFTYGYDGQRHLGSESRTGTVSYTKAYSLYGTGDRFSQLISGTTTWYTYDSDGELTGTNNSLGATDSYTYDANGNQITRTVGGVAYTLGYDYENELTSVTGGGHTSTYTYDAMGRRVTATVDGNTTITRFDGTRALRDSYMTYGGVVLGAYLYGNELISRDNYTGSSGHEWMAYDRIGSQCSTSDPSQNALGHKVYDGFGLVMNSTGTTDSPFRFGASSGYRTDSATGLVLVGSRYYDPQVGRFITRDTDLDEAPYVYCNADPINSVDEDGHSPVLIVIAIVVVVVVTLALRHNASKWADKIWGPDK